MFAPAINELYVADSWITGLSTPPVFSYELRKRVDAKVYIPMGGASVSMTEAQWQKWPNDMNDDGDMEYILNCVAGNLGFVRK